MVITGKNKDFSAVWSATKQKYSIYKGDKFIINVFSMTAAKNYID